MCRRAVCCSLALLTALVAEAHLDELTQVLEPEPLVLSFEAEALSGIGQAAVVADTPARGGHAVVLSGAGSGLALDFGPLPIGMHAVWVAAKVVQPDAFVESFKQQVTKPLYLKLAVNAGNAGEVITYRMRVPFSPDREYEYIAKIYFHTPVARAYSGQLTIGERSRVNDLQVDFIDLRNPLGELVFAAIKTKRTLVTDKEIMQRRQSAGAEGKLPAPLRAQPLDDAERRRRDTIIWTQSVMPLNANPAQIYGGIYRGNPELSEIIKRETAKLGELGKWEMPLGRSDTYDVPWSMHNAALDLTYTLDDYRAGRTLPEPWPFPEDCGAMFFDKDEWGCQTSFNYGEVPLAIQKRYHAILGALGATTQSQIPRAQADLPERYLLLGDLAAAADASFLLAAYAYHYPAYDWNLHCMVNIANADRTFTPGNVRGRGCSYQGWSTDEVQGVVAAYDALFPYIEGNQDLAQRVGRFVPWVRSAEDVVKLIDTFLVQRAAQDGVRHNLYSPIVPTAAVVLGPGPIGDKYLDMFVYGGQIYVRDARSAFVDSIVNGYSRDGLNYIGSTFYVIGESAGELFMGADLIERYVQAGGDRRFRVTDVTQFPRLRAIGDSLLGLYTAGGHRIGVGDVHDPQAPYRPWRHLLKDDTLDIYENIWNWTRDPQAAWILANRRGRGAYNDADWAKIAAAAASARDPLLHTDSRVLEGFGVARLEENVDAVDPRLKMSTVLRFGVGSGHAHPDTLDLEVYAYGIRATSDLGGRVSGQYGRPTCMSTFVHNLVEIDEGNFNDGPQNSTAQGWLTAFKPLPGSQYVAGAAVADAQPQVSEYRRGALQIVSRFGDEQQATQGYVFDVFRVTGGHIHTWCFHGCVPEALATNVPLQPATSDPAAAYLRRHRQGTQREGETPEVLEATWQLRRSEESIGEIKLKNAEQTILGDLYQPESPPKSTRVRLFGQQGTQTLVGNWYATSKRQHDFPFLYVRREGDEGMSSVFPALIEPYAGQPVIESARSLEVTAGSVALAVETVLGQQDVVIANPDRERETPVPGEITASGDVALISRDARGVRLATLIGGRTLAAPGLSIKVARSEYRATIKSMDYASFRARLEAPLPDCLAGETMTVSSGGRQTTFVAAEVDASTVVFSRSTRSYRGAVAYVDPAGAFAELDAKPFLASYHPSYYNGMTAVNEVGRVIGTVKVELGSRYWYLGWPPVRRHLAHIGATDLTDANGDGKVTVSMHVNPHSGTSGAQKFADDGETVVTLAAGEKMLDLAVSRLREDGLMLFTGQHPRIFLDALKVPHPGWPYHRQVIRNEAGDKEWIVNMPGDLYRLSMDGRAFTPADFPDPDHDGRALIALHEFGAGATLTVPVHVQLRRVADGTYEVRSNCRCVIGLPGSGMETSVDGETWSAVPSTQVQELATAEIDAPGDRLLLRIK